MNGLAEVEIRGPAAWIYINRPDKRNALDRATIRALVDAIKGAEGDERAKVVVLTGKGKVFSAGIDLSELARAQGPDDAGRIFSDLAGLFRALLSLDKPLLIALNGDAYGGGAEILWTGDAVVAVEGAKISWAEARWGLVPPALSTVGIFFLGPVRASYLAMSCSSITAREAIQMGLVTHVVPEEKLVEAVEGVAKAIMESSPEAVRAIKRLKRAVMLSPSIELGISELERLSRSALAHEASKAFVEKRKPSYKW